MKPLQIGLLVLVGALGGAVIMKFAQRPKPAIAPPAAPVAAAVPAAAAPPVTAETPVSPQPVTNAEPARPSPPAAARKPWAVTNPPIRARAVPPSKPAVIAQNQPPAQPEPPAPASPLPVEQPAAAPPISNDPAPAALPAPQPPPTPDAAPSVTLRAGTNLPIRLGENLSSEHNQAGDTFTGTLDAPLTVDGFVIAERGAHVEGRVVDAQKSGHKGKAVLNLELTKLDTSDGQHVVIKTDPLHKQGNSMATTDQVGIVAAAAGVGAIIGALAGGGKGAAIGAGAGGAAGGGGVVATRDKAISLPSETKLSFRLSDAVTLTERVNQ